MAVRSICRDARSPYRDDDRRVFRGEGMSSKTIIIGKTVSVCDTCGREDSWLQHCVVCGNEICSGCTFHHPDVRTMHLSFNDTMFGNTVCVDCGKIEGVIDVLKSYYKKWQDFSSDERSELVRLRNYDKKAVKG